MSLINPVNHQRKLREILEANGWRVAVIERATKESWLHSLWRLESAWRPVGYDVWVGFIGDPDNVEGKAYQLIVSGSRPEDQRAGDCFGLSPDWPEHLAGVVAAAARLRDVAMGSTQTIT